MGPEMCAVFQGVLSLHQRAMEQSQRIPEGRGEESTALLPLFSLRGPITLLDIWMPSPSLFPIASPVLASYHIYTFVYFSTYSTSNLNITWVAVPGISLGHLA